MTKIAQVGAGYWGKNLVRNFAELEALSAIVDPHPPTAEKLSADFGVEAKTLEEVLQDDQIAGVSFATPAETHAKFAMQALDAGKHVFIEKPLALLVEDAEALTAKADQAGLTLMVGHLLQYHPIFISLLKSVREGMIGKVQHIYSNRMSLGKFRLEENVWWSFAPHDLSMVLALADEEPVHLTAQGASYVTPGLADWATAQMKFSNGIQAHLNISWMHPFKEQRLVVMGEKGALVFEDSVADWDKKLAYYPHTLSKSEGLAPVPNKADVEYMVVEKGEPLKDECRHFIECIQSGEKPRTDGHEGLRVLRALSAGEESLARFMTA